MRFWHRLFKKIQHKPSSGICRSSVLHTSQNKRDNPHELFSKGKRPALIAWIHHWLLVWVPENFQQSILVHIPYHRNGVHASRRREVLCAPVHTGVPMSMYLLKTLYLHCFSAPILPQFVGFSNVWSHKPYPAKRKEVDCPAKNEVSTQPLFPFFSHQIVFIHKISSDTIIVFLLII